MKLDCLPFVPRRETRVGDKAAGAAGAAKAAIMKGDKAGKQSSKCLFL